MSPHVVLITGGGTATALSVLKGLRIQQELPVRVVLADCSPTVAGRHLADAFVQIPPAGSERFADELLRLAIELGVRMIVPIFDLELPILAESQDRFVRAGIRVVISSLEAVARCTDKLETFRFFRQHGVPTPATYTPEEALVLPPAAYPLFVKPRRGRGSVDVWRAGSRGELRRVLAHVAEPLVQECVEGADAREVTIDTLSDQSGAFVACCPRYRQVVKAGQSYQGLTFADEFLSDLCRRVCEALPIIGPACIQCFQTARGPLFFEVNPRFGAASILSIRAGLDGPSFLLREVLGLAQPPLAIRPGLQMLRYWEEVFVDTVSGELLPPSPLRPPLESAHARAQ